MVLQTFFFGGGGVNKVHYCLREKGNWILSQLMVGGVIGWPGHNVVWRVVVELRVELDLVPIPRHNMAAKSVVEKRIKSAPAMLSHAQVNNFNCIFFFGYYIQLLSVRANFVNVYGIDKCSFSSYLTSSSNILVKCPLPFTATLCIYHRAYGITYTNHNILLITAFGC